MNNPERTPVHAGAMGSVHGQAPRMQGPGRSVEPAGDSLALSRGLFEHSPVAYALFRPDGRCLLTNQAFRSLFGREAAPEYDFLRDELMCREGLDRLLGRAFEGETVHAPTVWFDAAALAPRCARDGGVAIACTFIPLRGVSGEVAQVAIAYADVTTELQQQQRAEASECEARLARDRAQFMAEASKVLSESLDTRRILTKLAELMVPRSCDWCSVALIEGERLERLAVLHRDPAKQATADEVCRSLPLAGLREAMHELVVNGPIRRSHVDDARLRAFASPEQLALLEELGLGCCMLVPLIGRSGPLGVLSLARSDAVGSFTGDDLLFVEELASRAALAVDNARLFSEVERQASLHEAIIDNSNVGIIVADSDAVLRIVNAAAAEQHGIAAVGVPGEQWSSTYGLYTLDRRPLPLNDTPLFLAVHGQTIENAHWIVRRPDGAFRNLVGTATPLRRPDGTLSGAVLVTRDETERVGLEEKLRLALETLKHDRESLNRTELEFRAIFELAAVGMAKTLPPTGRFTRVNQKLAEITGYSREELLNMSFSDLTHPDDREADRRGYQQMLSGEMPVYQVEKRYLRKDGSVIWVQVTATALRDAQGAAQQTAAVVLDITARRIAENRARAIAENATLGLYMLDARQALVFMNRAAERITGYDFAEVQGKVMHEIVHHTRPDGSPFPIEDCPIKRALVEGRRRQGEEVMIHRDGHFFPVAFTASPLRDADFKPLGIVVELRDTTLEKSVEAEREQLMHELKQAVRARDDFLSVAGHEIRTPLAALQLNLYMLARAVQRDSALADRPRLRERIGKTQDSADRLERFTERLLDVSRVVSGELRLERERFDLAELVREVCTRFVEQAAKSRTELRVSAAAPVLGTWDRLRMEQVVSNLLTNALKYGRGKPVEVDARVVSGRACLTVQDHGIGIEPDQHKRIFERFERAVSNRHYGGLGLGLWIVRQVVEASGGTIAVHSRPGSGSLFTVTLPLSDPGCVSAS